MGAVCNGAHHPHSFINVENKFALWPNLETVSKLLP
jgi:hypothetical protein